MGVKLAIDDKSGNEEDEVPEVNVATYERRSKTGESKMRGVKPLKWPVLTEWNVTPAEVLKMQIEDKTLDKCGRWPEKKPVNQTAKLDVSSSK